jgi:hypothetical protein
LVFGRKQNVINVNSFYEGGDVLKYDKMSSSWWRSDEEGHGGSSILPFSSG